jgi:hypothetical protein
MDRVERPETAVRLTHGGIHDLIIDRDVGEGGEQVPGLLAAATK